MKNQNPFVVLILTIVTFGIYGIFWYARTRGEMNKLGANVPTTWLIIVPFVNIYYIWKWSEGVQIVSDNKMNGVIAFILQVLLGVIGMAIIQDTFNKVQGNSFSSTPAPIVPQQSANQTAPENLGAIANAQNINTNQPAKTPDKQTEQINSNLNNQPTFKAAPVITNNVSESINPRATQPIVDVVKPAEANIANQTVDHTVAPINSASAEQQPVVTNNPINVTQNAESTGPSTANDNNLNNV